jgi:hypothetical protein
VLLYLAVVPAAAFEDLGPVLAITGAVGGSCLAYIGPECGVFGRARWTVGIGARVLVGIEIVGQSVRSVMDPNDHFRQFTKEVDRGNDTTSGGQHSRSDRRREREYCCQGTEASRKEMEDESPLVLSKQSCGIRVSCRLVLLRQQVDKV